MQLPYSEELNIEYLGQLFRNTTECYKFFWFKAIVKKVTKGKDEKAKKTKEIETKNVKHHNFEKFKIEKRNYTLYELEQSFKELEEKEEIVNNIVMDINALKLKNKNLKKKIENASNYIEEIKYTFSTMISVDYYLAHPDTYEKDRIWVLMLNEYLKKHADALLTAESLNERSFEIWHREKFLDREQGKKILKRCGLNVEALNVYRTTEPLSYYTHTRNTPQNILILENKDPFFSMRNYLLNGHTEIFGAEIGTLIYGAGKGIIRSFQDFDLCAEPYMKHPKNTIYYFGDLDYEGIGIYENLAEKFRSRWKIIPFVPAYQAMLGKAEQITELPETKEHQNRNISTQFFSCFDEIIVKKMEAVLDKDRYIPQEILNTADF